MSAVRLLLVLLVAAAPVALAKTALELETHDSYFVLAGGEEKNPTLFVRPGEPVAVTVVQKGVQPHNWVVDGLEGARAPASGVLDERDEAATAAFTAPAAGDLEYYCTVHPPTMRGVLRVGEGGPAPPARDTPAPGWAAAAAVAVALALARRA